MRDRTRAHWLVAGLACAACGTQPVELLPQVGPRDNVEQDVMLDKNVPASALERLRAAPNEVGAEALQFLYPAPPELVLPADLAPLAFEWQLSTPKPADSMKPPGPMAGMPAPAPPADPMKPEPMKAEKAKAEANPLLAYELRAHSDHADVRMYVAAQGGAFPRDRWTELMRQHTGGSLRLELRGVRQSGAIVHASAVELRIRPPLQGAFFSFSTTAQGLMRGELSRTHETLSSPSTGVAIPPNAGCVGCHALSSDGQRGLAAIGSSGNLFSWSFASGGAALSLESGAPSSDGYVFGALDRTAARLARVQTGRLAIFNADTGALLQQSPAPLVAASTAPDWSPDGRAIALILQGDKPEPEEAKGGSLAKIVVALDGSLSDPQTLVTAGKDESLFWPVYSPYDGAWIAYEKRKGPARDARDAKVFLVRASGGEPIELSALRDKPMSDAAAPSFVPGDTPEHVYLVFSSHRAVGSFMPAEGQRQLFAAALDLSLAAAGKDPSGQAFWLPFQQRSSNYLRAQWAPAVRACSPNTNTEVCDDMDDDCDGKVDEDCVRPSPESCDNQSDDDYDGAIDEGCGCNFSELCGNQKDDDCDLHTDEQPCMPVAPGK